MPTEEDIIENSTVIPWESITLKSVLNNTERTLKDVFYNGTGYYIEDDSETGFSDWQTLTLACFATLIPLIITLITAFTIRILWRRYKNKRKNDSYDGILSKEDTSESISRPLHSHLFSNDKKCQEMDINTEEVQVCDNISQIRNNHSNTNGSIITMTLKNNHLIVETEERNDIEEDCRETTMRYSPGARDGVFVVEVQQGIRRSPGSKLINSITDQCAVVHNPPERYTEPKEASPKLSQVLTGLSQSCNSLNSYSYTNQQAYNNGPFGYPLPAVEEPLRTLLMPSCNNKPKITGAVYKAQFCQLEDSENEMVLESTTEHILMQGKDSDEF